MSTTDAVDLLHEVGKSLNPAIDLGQIEGGFVQGMGWLTTEELWWDDRGALRTHAPSTYKIPACGESNQVDTTSNASGVLTVTGFQLLASDTNAHASLLGQPANINCSTKLCEVVITPTHGGGGSGSYAGDSAEFNVS